MGRLICVRIEDEKRCILESRHAGIEGNCICVLVGSHLGRNKTIEKYIHAVAFSGKKKYL